MRIYQRFDRVAPPRCNVILMLPLGRSKYPFARGSREVGFCAVKVDGPLISGTTTSCIGLVNQFLDAD